MRYIDYFSGGDVFLIFAYVAFFIALGVIANRRVKNSSDFSSAGQSLSWVMVAGSTIVTTMGANMVVGKYDLIFAGGFSGISTTLFWWVGWIFLLLMAKPLRASGATSIPSLSGNGTPTQMSGTSLEFHLHIIQ